MHLATLEMDAGPILAQEVVPVLPGDTEETLHERIKVVERTLYPATVAWALGELEAGRAIVGPARQAVRAAGADRDEMQTRSRPGDDVVRALLSVYDKEGLVELAQGLSDLGWELVASGNTVGHADARPASRTSRWPTSPARPRCSAAGSRPCTPRSTAASWPTASKPEHLADLATNGIEAIDLVVSNLYPFSSDPSIELIDIGGPAMVRAAAKNHDHVGIVTSPADYPVVLDELRTSGVALAPPRGAGWPGPPSPTPPPTTPPSSPGSTPAGPTPVADLDGATTADAEEAELSAVLPPTLHLTLERTEVLRYGENPHQRGARYRIAGTRELVGRHGPARREPAVLPQPLRRRRRLAAGARAGGRRR